MSAPMGRRRGARPPRSSPHLPTYLRAGAAVGFLAGAGLAVFGEETPMSSMLQQVVLLGVLFGAVGVLLAAMAYLFADWRHERPPLR